MIDGDDGIAVTGHELFHDGVHVGVAVLGKDFLEHRQLGADVPEMDAEQAVLVAQLFDIRHQVAEVAAAFQPAADAELGPQGLAAAGSPEGPAVALHVVDQAGDPGHAGQRGIVGVERQPDAGLLGHRDDPLHEIGEIVPDLILGVGAVFGVGAGKDLVLVAVHGNAAPGVLADFPGRAQDAVGLPRDGGKGNLLLPEHPEHLVEPVNLVIPVGQAQVDALVFLQFHAGGIGDAQAEGGQLVFLCPDGFGGKLIRPEHQADILDAHLTDELKCLLAFGRADGDLRTHRHSMFPPDFSCCLYGTRSVPGRQEGFRRKCAPCFAGSDKIAENEPSVS